MRKLYLGARPKGTDVEDIDGVTPTRHNRELQLENECGSASAVYQRSSLPEDWAELRDRLTHV
jgi:hypothetical protein